MCCAPAAMAQAQPGKSIAYDTLAGYLSSEAEERESATAPLSLASPRALPDSAWEKLTAPPAFAYRTKKESAALPPKPSEPSLLERIVKGLIAFLATAGGRALLWMVLLAAVGYVLYRLLFKEGKFAFGSPRKVESRPDGQPDEEDLQGTDWLKLLDNAAAAGNLREAVRYGYLHVLQVLQDQGRIDYRPGKTNRDYYNELAGGRAAPLFRSLSRQYEYTWYGGYSITAPLFEAYRAELQTLKNQPGA
jgi:hypothetical protein